MPSWDDGRNLNHDEETRFLVGFNRILAELGEPATTIEELEDFEELTGERLCVRSLGLW